MAGADMTTKKYGFEDRLTVCKLCHHLTKGRFPYEKYRPYQDWQTSTEDGCAGCNLVATVLRHLGFADTTVLIKLETLYGPRVNLKSAAGTRAQIVLCIKDSERALWPFFDFDGSDNTVVTTLPLSPTHTADTDSIQRLESALHTCDTKHACLKTQSSWLPTRILDLTNGHIRLCYSDQISRQPKPYIALSHCWSGHAVFITTAKNIDDRLLGIIESDLPRTYSEAIYLTRKLGINYLWIDSLCIIQDDEKDWALESAMMASIFQLAYATIGADLWSISPDTLEKSPVDGCLTPVEIPLVSISHPTKKDKTYSVYAKLCGTGLDDNFHAPGPILGRGWVFQERVLSSRYIWCKDTELVLHCTRGITCYCQRHHVDSWFLPDEWLKILIPGSTLAMTDWTSIIEAYSKLHLTYSKDIFAALSGCAKQFRSARPDTYLAGLWKTDLISGLQWFTLKTRPRPAVWRAPTWSWAAGVGGCQYHHEGPNLHDEVSILDASVVASSSDSTGSLRSAYIKLSGKIMSANIVLGRVFRQEFGYDDTIYTPNTLVDSPDAKIFLSHRAIFFDYDIRLPGASYLPSNSAVVLLLLATDPNSSLFRGLILKPVSTSGDELYERVGHVEVDTGMVHVFSCFGKDQRSHIGNSKCSQLCNESQKSFFGWHIAARTIKIV